MQIHHGSDRRDFDVIVVGSGGNGLTAALAAAERGARVAILEKADVLGGTTALSGGMLWMPGNGIEGGPDPETDRREARRYLDAVTWGRAEGDLLDAHVERVPEVLAFLHDVGGVRFQLIGSFPDYESEHDGASPEGGRSVEPELFDVTTLGEHASLVRADPRLPFRQVEYFEGWKTLRNMPVAELQDRRARNIAARGRALVAPLVKAVLERDITVVTGCAAERLLRDGERVSGVLAGGEEWQAAAGVVLAAGGFEWNDDMCRRFLSGPIEGRCSNPLNVGDGHRMAMKAGADLSGMSEAWWGIMADVPGLEVEGRSVSTMMGVERGLPGTIMVNREGQRFVDESISYYSVGKVLAHFDTRALDYKNLPAWMIGDAAFFRKFGILGHDALDALPPSIASADTLDELARKLGIDPDGLAGTVARFNEHAMRGVDPDFGRGETRYGNYFGDPELEGNPNLAPLTEGPYVALRVLCGAIGTKGGVRTDRDGRALDPFGDAIPGLYAAGNNAAHTIAFGYPGAGGTLGPGMTLAYATGQAVALEASVAR